MSDVKIDDERHERLKNLSMLARAGKLPSFMTEHVRGGKRALTNYPRSVLLHGSIGRWLFGLMFAAIPAVAVTAAMQLREVAELPAFVVSIALMVCLTLIMLRHGRRAREFLELADAYPILTESLGKTVEQLNILKRDTVQGLVDLMMWDDASQIMRFQRNHERENPLKWRPRQKEMMDAFGRKYDVLKPLGFTAPGGYHFYFQWHRGGRKAAKA